MHMQRTGDLFSPFVAEVEINGDIIRLIGTKSQIKAEYEKLKRS